MDSSERKKVAVIAKYIIESFSDGDWYSLGQVTGKLKAITEHPRLFRSLSFGDDDYPYCVAEVLDTIFSEGSSLIPEVIDYFDIDLWYQQKDPEKHKKIFIVIPIKRFYTYPVPAKHEIFLFSIPYCKCPHSPELI